MRGTGGKGMGWQSLRWPVKAEGVQMTMGAGPRRGVVPKGEGPEAKGTGEACGCARGGWWRGNVKGADARPSHGGWAARWGGWLPGVMMILGVMKDWVVGGARVDGIGMPDK
jgi:hypothetical protein